MPRLIAFTLALVLAACAAPPQGYRDAGLSLAPLAGFDRGIWAGEWLQAGDFAFVPRACPRGRLTILPAAEGQVVVSGTLCVGGEAEALGLLADVDTSGGLQMSGAGMRRAGAKWQVLRVGNGGETLAIGTNSGAFGLILARHLPITFAETEAIRAVFRLRGYDLNDLRILR